MYKYACEFTVTGLGPVPVDMMRYDRATPVTQEDASKAGEPLNFTLPPTHSIRMIRFTEGKGRNYADNPTVRRWNSFGWQVSDVTFRKLSA